MNHATAVLMIKALDGLAARQAATAENIANAGTPGYHPLRVSFEDALKNAAAQGEDAVKQLSFSAEPAPASDGAMRLDLELATASTTALRYQALIDLFDRQLQLESLAATGGR